MSMPFWCRPCNMSFEDLAGLDQHYAMSPAHSMLAKEDLVNHPSHYKKGGIECIDYLTAKLSPEELKGMLKGNCIKYLSRAADKLGGAKELEDYKKAQWYLNRLVAELGKTPTT